MQRARLPEGGLLYALQFLAVAGAYFATGKFGLSLAFATESVTAIWAPTGIALVALVLGGYRLWPAVALGALLTNLDTGVPAYVVLGITVGNTLEALAGAFLLRRVARFEPRLERLRDVLALIGFGAIFSTMISATIGTLTLLAAGELSGGDYGTAWRTWWLGDMGGDLLIAPALFVAFAHWPYRLVTRRWPEALATAAAVGAVGAVVFAQETALTYVTFPPLIWGAFRFRQVGATAGSLVLGVIAVAMTEDGLGPFAMSSPDDRLLLAQTFVAVGCAMALVLAAVTSERRRAEDRAQGIATTLQASLLPRTLPTLPGVESATFFRAAGEGHRVGGDFYDVFELPEGHWGLIVGDVRGKGAKAAAITALVRYTLRNAALEEGQPSRLLELVHASVLREYEGEEFCTAVCASFELESPSPRVTISCGGHPLPLAITRDGGVAPVGEAGMLLGTPHEPELADTSHELLPGDSLVFYTDGLIDAYAPERTVGEEELREVLGRSARRGPEELIAAIRAALLESGKGEPRDDIAIVALRRVGGQVRRARNLTAQ